MNIHLPLLLQSDPRAVLRLARYLGLSWAFGEPHVDLCELVAMACVVRDVPRDR